jgi:hypothetical protein
VGIASNEGDRKKPRRTEEKELKNCCNCNYQARAPPKPSRMKQVNRGVDMPHVFFFLSFFYWENETLTAEGNLKNSSPDQTMSGIKNLEN